MLLPLLYHVSPASARSFRSVFSVAFFLPPCYIKNVEYLFFRAPWRRRRFFGGSFFALLHTERPLRTGFFRIGLYSNLYGQTDEEILIFLFRSTFFPTLHFFDSFPFKSKGRRHAPVQGVAALPVSPVTETERSFSCVLLLFPLASFKLESLLFPEDAPNVQLVGQQVESLLPA